MGRNPRDTELAASTRRWMWAGVGLMALFVVMFPIYRIYEPAQRAEAREAQNEELALVGGELYEANCTGCHGPKGLGALAPAVGSQDFLQLLDDDQIGLLIGLGVPGTEMVAYSLDYGGPLTSTEIRSITLYLRSLEEEAEPNPLWRTPLANEAFNGEQLYGLACARCHGVDRMGIEDVAPDISGTSLTMDESDEWIGSRIRDGFKGMPRFGGILNDGQIAQIVDYLRGGTGEVVTTTTAPGDGSSGSTTTTTMADEVDEEQLTLGKEIFDVTAGGVGCASCHGFDAQGTADGPNIVGSSKSAISGALGGGVLDMEDIKLSPTELDAVYAYLVLISSP